MKDDGGTGAGTRADWLPLPDRVHADLVVELMTGRRAPGQRLKIDDIARDLNVSHTPVREALVRLERTGFVERHARRGYVVARLLDSVEMAQLMEARLLMEPTMAELATARVDPEFLERLRVTIESMQKVGASADAEGLVECWMADEAFHTLIAGRSGNPFLARSYGALGGQLQRFRIIAGSGVPHARTACREHDRVFRAMSQGSEAGARSAMQGHLQNAKERALDDLERIRALRVESTPAIVALAHAHTGIGMGSPSE